MPPRQRQGSSPTANEPPTIAQLQALTAEALAEQQIAEQGDGDLSNKASWSILYQLGQYLLRERLGLHILPDITSKATNYQRILYEAKFAEGWGKQEAYETFELLAQQGLHVPEGFYYLRVCDGSAWQRFVRTIPKVLIEFQESADEFNLRHLLSNNTISGLGDMHYELLEVEYHAIREGISELLIDFWQPLYKPKSSGIASPLEAYTLQMLQMQSQSLAAEGVKDVYQGISHRPRKVSKKSLIPRAFVPELSWFDSRFHSLRIADILTLLPHAEQEIFAYSIGRALAGCHNSITTDGERILHGWRKFPILYGKEPGQGKTTLCNYVIRGMQLCGYRIANFKSLSRHFGLGRILLADLAYRDDFTSTALQQTLSADDTKPAISGATLEVEDKNAHATEEYARCLFLANVNKFDPRIRFGLDGGIIDRLCFLTTLSNVELQLLRERIDGISTGSPSLYTHLHIPWLAEKLDTSPELVMMYFMRLCLDKFLATLRLNDANTKSQLELELKHWSARLRTTLDGEYGTSLAMCIILGVMLNQPTPEALATFAVPELTPTTLQRGLSAYARFAFAKESHYARGLLKDAWEREGRPMAHPWKAVSKMLGISIMQACEALASIGQKQQSAGVNMDLPNAVKLGYGALLTVEGHPLGAGVPYVLEDWEHARVNANYLRDLANAIIRELSQCSAGEPVLNFLREPGYAWRSSDFAHLSDWRFDRHEFAISQPPLIADLSTD